MQINCFEDLSLSKEVLSGIEELGFESLFPIQAQAIGPLLEGKDVIGQAHTGTGKTAAFGIPMIDRLISGNNGVQGLILEPTRELAVQTAEHIRQLCKYTNYKVLAIYGGSSIRRQIDKLNRGIHIVVGTPGRIIDHIKRRTLKLGKVRMVVLDEADRMLDMGFIKDIDYILSKVPADRQTSLFSATIDQSVWKICNRYLKNAEKILVSKDEIALKQIDQHYVIVKPRDKLDILCSILDDQPVDRAIIFCKTRRGTSKVADKLKARGYDAKPLHGGFTQSQRNFAVNSFRKGKLQFLIATDVAARGLDIEGITHIINYDIPLDALVYFHRIGRTARMGLEGTAITLVSYGQMSELNRIKALTKTTIEELKGYHASKREPVKTYKGICSDCGNECKVPFKPERNRPIYCKKCWGRRRPAIVRVE
ncbi:MAG: DEAD/DEAH box helicase [Candidatus Bathyarchaeia archaeon]